MQVEFSTNTPLKTLILERIHAHAAREIVAVRDELISPARVVALRTSAERPAWIVRYDVSMDPAIPDWVGIGYFYSLMERVVCEVAWGEAALRHKGLLRAITRPFPADQKAILKALELPKRDLEALRQRCAADGVKIADGEPSTAQLSQLQDEIENLNKIFSEPCSQPPRVLHIYALALPSSYICRNLDQDDRVSREGSHLVRSVREARGGHGGR